MKTEEEAIYLPPFYHAEVGTARRLTEIYAHPGGVRVTPLGLTERIENATGIAYDEIQMEAILTAVESKILILTGGPGTGKTTTTLGIITAFREAGARILLAAPTGRAAKRLSETTGMEAKTIHRLLETKPPDGYQRNADNPLEGDVLIVDECSMIDVRKQSSVTQGAQRRRRDIARGLATWPDHVSRFQLRAVAAPLCRRTGNWKEPDALRRVNFMKHTDGKFRRQLSLLFRVERVYVR